MRVPIVCFIRGHTHWRFRRAPAVESAKDRVQGQRPMHPSASRQRIQEVLSYLCISDADVLTPLHSSTTRPTNATDSKKRVRVRTTHIALTGGSLAFADFHVTPPLGSNITTRPPGPPTAPPALELLDYRVGRSRAVAPSSGSVEGRWTAELRVNLPSFTKLAWQGDVFRN
jgi:hypothetical protein